MSHRILLAALPAASVSATPALAGSSFIPPAFQSHAETPRAPQGEMQRTPHGDMGEMQRGQHPDSGEMQRMPHGYMPPSPPRGIESRPPFNRDDFNHNYQSNRGHRIGPYHGPDNWEYRRWRFGEVLPQVFWGDQYWLGDYWLFGLDVPPVGYEWVRYGPDAILVNITTGEIAQVVYGVFL